MALPRPHQLCVDTSVSAQAYRVWGVIDFLKRNRIAPRPDIIADLLQVTERSVERWIAELHKARWLVWTKNAADPWRRFELRHSNSEEEVALARIRALFASGEATIEAIARVLRNDTDVGNDTDVETSDRTIVDSDTDVEASDRTIAGFDTTIASDSTTADCAALKRDPVAHDGGGGDSSSRKKRSPTASTIRAQTTAASPTVTEIWLRAEGVSKKKARQFAAFDINAVQQQWAEDIPPAGRLPESARQQRIGRLLDRWEVRPPSVHVARAPYSDGPIDVDRYCNGAYGDLFRRGSDAFEPHEVRRE
jgi:hypothetical protein